MAVVKLRPVIDRISKFFIRNVKVTDMLALAEGEKLASNEELLTTHIYDYDMYNTDGTTRPLYPNAGPFAKPKWNESTNKWIEGGDSYDVWLFNKQDLKINMDKTTYKSGLNKEFDADKVVIYTEKNDSLVPVSPLIDINDVFANFSGGIKGLGDRVDRNMDLPTLLMELFARTEGGGFKLSEITDANLALTTGRYNTTTNNPSGWSNASLMVIGEGDSLTQLGFNLDKNELAIRRYKKDGSGGVNSSTKFSDWAIVGESSDYVKKGDYDGTVKGITDCDLMTKPNIPYYINPSVSTNNPGFFAILMVLAENQNYFIQIAYGLTSNIIAYRRYSHSANPRFTKWIKLDLEKIYYEGHDIYKLTNDLDNDKSINTRYKINDNANNSPASYGAMYNIGLNSSHFKQIVIPSGNKNSIFIRSHNSNNNPKFATEWQKFLVTGEHVRVDIDSCNKAIKPNITYHCINSNNPAVEKFFPNGWNQATIFVFGSSSEEGHYFTQIAFPQNKNEMAIRYYRRDGQLGVDTVTKFSPWTILQGNNYSGNKLFRNRIMVDRLRVDNAGEAQISLAIGNNDLGFNWIESNVFALVSHAGKILQFSNNKAITGTDNVILSTKVLEGGSLGSGNNKDLYINTNNDSKVYVKGSDNKNKDLTTAIVATKSNVGKVFIDARQDFTADAYVSLAIGDDNTGFDWISNGKISFKSDGYETFRMSLKTIALNKESTLYLNNISGDTNGTTTREINLNTNNNGPVNFKDSNGRITSLSRFFNLAIKSGEVNGQESELNRAIDANITYRPTDTTYLPRGWQPSKTIVEYKHFHDSKKGYQLAINTEDGINTGLAIRHFDPGRNTEHHKRFGPWKILSESRSVQFITMDDVLEYAKKKNPTNPIGGLSYFFKNMKDYPYILTYRYNHPNAEVTRLMDELTAFSPSGLPPNFDKGFILESYPSENIWIQRCFIEKRKYTYCRNTLNGAFGSDWGEDANFTPYNNFFDINDGNNVLLLNKDRNQTIKFTLADGNQVSLQEVFQSAVNGKQAIINGLRDAGANVSGYNNNTTWNSLATQIRTLTPKNIAVSPGNNGFRVEVYDTSELVDGNNQHWKNQGMTAYYIYNLRRPGLYGWSFDRHFTIIKNTKLTKTPIVNKHMSSGENWLDSEVSDIMLQVHSHRSDTRELNNSTTIPIRLVGVIAGNDCCFQMVIDDDYSDYFFQYVKSICIFYNDRTN